ncbi:MAG: hypothetical protein WBN94_10690 [Methanothrix sp.]
MSSMTPVVLVSLPNLPYLLGTFDTTSFRQWWRSAPFPDDLEEIKKGFHIYGRTHLALAQRKDGRWAIYRSKNYGIDWARVFLAAPGEVIYDIVLITFGRAVLNTSLGFYETVNAGTTWDLVLDLPTAPNAPAFCNIGGGDVLMCTDGRYIWRSTNIARSWTRVCDMHSVRHTTYYYSMSGYYTGPSIPCISGANGRVFAANGPFLVRSDDGGLTFGVVAYWEYYPGLASLIFRPPQSLVYDRLWPMTTNPGFLISQILISSIDGPEGDDVVFILKMNDVRPVVGSTELFAWTLKTWTSNPVLAKNNHWKPIFQQYLTPSEGETHIDSYNVAVLGQNYNDKLTFSAQTRLDPATGKPIPSLKYTNDGGETWTDVDLNKIQIGNAEGGGICSGSMMDDNFAKLTWVGPACNNYGSYDYVEQSRRQCQSYEFDAVIEHAGPTARQVSESLDALVEKAESEEESLDALIEQQISLPYDIDALVEGMTSKSYLLDRTLEGQTTEEESLDAIVALDVPVLYDLDTYIWARPRAIYHLNTLLHDKVSASYLCDVIIVEYKLGERLSMMEHKIPQFFDLVVPSQSHGAFSSKEMLV